LATAHFGTHALAHLLENTTNIDVYGEQRLVNDIRTSLNAHNAAVNAMAAVMMDETQVQQEAYGGFSTQPRVRGYKVNEFGAVDVQRARVAVTPGTIGYPLERVQFAWQVTRDYVERATVNDAAVRALAIQQGDLDLFEYEVKNALFNPVNNTTWQDYLVDNMPYQIKRLANADSSPLPVGPNGQVFNAATHTHYVGRAGGALAATDISALITNVIEHGVTGAVQVLINRADETAIRLFPNFYAFQATEIVVLNPVAGTVTMRDPGPLVDRVNPTNPDNMAIGRWDAKYDVMTRPWVPAGYTIVRDSGRNPLRRRTRPGRAGRGDLRIVADHEHFPLRAQWMEREYGIGVGDRTAMAILYNGGTSYVAPTFSLPAL
jgi:hypothetical protein